MMEPHPKSMAEEAMRRAAEETATGSPLLVAAEALLARLDGMSQQDFTMSAERREKDALRVACQRARADANLRADLIVFIGKAREAAEAAPGVYHETLAAEARLLLARLGVK